MTEKELRTALAKATHFTERQRLLKQLWHVQQQQQQELEQPAAGNGKPQEGRSRPASDEGPNAASPRIARPPRKKLAVAKS